MKFVFLHGLIGNSSNWDQVTDGLKAQGYECLAPEIPYLDRKMCSIEEFADHVYQVLGAAFRDGQSVVVGNSIGGSVALHLSDVFSATFMVGAYTGINRYPLPRARAKVRDWLLKIVHDPAVITDAELEYYMNLYSSLIKSPGSLRHLKRLKTAIESFDHDTLYCKFQSKLHIVHGLFDNLSPPYIFKELKMRFPQITLHEIDNCGHAIPLEQPNKLAEILLKEAARQQIPEIDIHAAVS